MKFKVGDLVKLRNGDTFIVKEIKVFGTRTYLRKVFGEESGVNYQACTLVQNAVPSYYFY
jgi:hypothetical protein